MSVETGTTISELDELWPLGTDRVLEGDNHVRLIKAVLKTQFPGVDGNGFNKAITATEDELNYLSGATSNIQEQLDVLSTALEENRPIGTMEFRMDDTDPGDLFPGTWALLQADAAIRIGDGTIQSTIAQGDDIVSVPLPEHRHSMSHTHSRGTMEITGSFIQDTQNSSGTFSGLHGAFSGTTEGQESAGVNTVGTAGNNFRRVNFKASNNWSGNTSSASTSNTGYAGVEDAEIDVTGSVIYVNVWIRES